MTKEEYINSRYDDYLQYWTSIALGFGPLVVLSLIPLDYLVSPGNFRAFVAYRFCTAAFLFLIYLFNRGTTSRKYVNISVILAATAVSTMVALMIARFGGHQSPYTSGFILVGIFVSGIVPLNFGVCLISSMIVYAIFFIPILLYDRITNVPYFASESILIFACISTMLILRYLGNKRLFHEFKLQFDIEQYKASLEDQVRNRTYQLSQTIVHLEQGVQDREKAERKLIESQDLFRHLVDDSPLAIAMITQDGTIEYVNKKHVEIMGYICEDIPTLERWWSLVCPDATTRERVTREWRDITERVLAGERIGNIERTFICKDGSSKDVELRIARAADKIIVAFDDISDRRRMADLVLQAKEDWEDTFNTINDAITIHDKDFNIIRANSAAVNMLGHSVKEIVGHKCFSLYHGSSEAPEGCPSCLTLKNGTSSLTELFEPHLNRYLEIKALPRRDRTGTLIGVIHVVRDITEKKIAEQALADQQGFASNLIENSSVGTFVLDINHRVMLWNKACEELTGCSSAEMIGTDNQWKPFYAKQRPTVADIILDNRTDDLHKLYHHYSRSALNPLAFKAEGWYRNLGGKDRYIAFEASPIFNSNRKLIASIETLQDLTESKRLEEQLLQAQKMEAVGQLAGGVAHDFNNILTAIIGYGELLQDSLDKDNPLRNYVDIMHGSAERASHLTQSLLAFSRKQVISLKPLKLNDVVMKSEKLLTRLISEDIELETLLSDKDLTVMADAGHIEQVLMNLVANARDAMPKGGQIIITTEKIQMDSEFVDARGYDKAGRYALLSVSDNGEGIDSKTRDKIFEPFFTTKEQGKGTGLGLSMVYGIVKQHGGFIDVDSEPGKGTVFKVYLPLSEGNVEMKEAREDSATIKGGAETVLLAEDDSSVRKLISTILHNQGYTVIEAIDGEDAVQKFSNNSDIIQLLILDGIMPKKNGKEAFYEIRLINPSVKALFVSGYAKDIVTKQGLLEPDANFIQKPLSPTVLLKKVRELLDPED